MFYTVCSRFSKGDGEYRYAHFKIVYTFLTISLGAGAVQLTFFFLSNNKSNIFVYKFGRSKFFETNLFVKRFFFLISEMVKLRNVEMLYSRIMCF